MYSLTRRIKKLELLAIEYAAEELETYIIRYNFEEVKSLTEISEDEFPKIPVLNKFLSISENYLIKFINRLLRSGINDKFIKYEIEYHTGIKYLIAAGYDLSPAEKLLRECALMGASEWEDVSDNYYPPLIEPIFPELKEIVDNYFGKDKPNE